MYEAGPKCFYPQFLQSISDQPPPGQLDLPGVWSAAASAKEIIIQGCKDCWHLKWVNWFSTNFSFPPSTGCCCCWFLQTNSALLPPSRLTLVVLQSAQGWQDSMLKRILSRLVWHIGVGGKNTAVEDIFFLQAIKIEEMTVCLYGDSSMLRED